MNEHTNTFDSEPVAGQLVTGHSDGPGYHSTWSGIYEGVRPSDWDGQPYHYFRDGEINGVKQSHFGHPVDRSTIDILAADAAINAHACELGPDLCDECDRLWSDRADAHDSPIVVAQRNVEIATALARAGVPTIIRAGRVEIIDSVDSGKPSDHLVPCWECREDGDPWCHDCDQCNPDGMYLEDGTEADHG